MHTIIKILTLWLFCSNFVFVTRAQCPTPELYDLGLSEASTTPMWVNCIDNVSTPDDFTLSLVSPEDIQNYTINWGDGTPNTVGSNWVAGTSIDHAYSQLGEFTVTLTETANGCDTEIQGTLINDRKPGATATPPTLNTSGCTPHTLTFVNQTTNVSPFTVYEWNWGDRSIDSVLSPSEDGASGNSISHQYLPNTSDCGMQVTLTAQSLCQTTFVTFGPYDFWDYDSALVSASQTQICQGEQITFNDVSDYNCVTGPRYIQWDLTEVGQGTTDWLPAVPSNQTRSAFVDGPVGSTFTINFADSNFCGIDYNSVTVEIVAPPTARVSVAKDSVCVGESVVFENQTTGRASVYRWDFNDGTRVNEVSKSDQFHSFDNEGEYWVKLRAGVAGTPSCSSVDSVKVVVLKAPDLKLESSVKESCDTTLIEFSQTHSVDALTVSWNFGQGDSEIGEGPFLIRLNEEGLYVATVMTSNSSGCSTTDRDTVVIYPKPLVSFTADSVCIGDSNSFSNLSSIPFQQTNGVIRETWQNVRGSNVSDLTSLNTYPENPDESNIINDFEYDGLGINRYGSRVHGFLVPPQTGFYTFWIASDDKSELWISESTDTSNLTKIASVPQFTNFRQWSKFSEQQSVTVELQANKLYYIKALHKESGGGDHLSVGWQLPNGTLERPIREQHLKIFSNAFLVKSVLWDFRDGNTSSENKVEYPFADAGERYVTLTVETHQCKSTDSLLVKVKDGAKPNFVISDTTSCSPLEVDFYNTSLGATAFTWNLGDGKTVNSSNLDTVSNVYFNNDTTSKSFFITLFADNTLGCAGDIRKEIVVQPNSNVSLDIEGENPPCAPVEMKFLNTSIKLAGNDYQWVFQDSIVDHNDDTLVYVYQNNTGKILFDTVSLKVSTGFGCVDSVSKVVTVFPSPSFSIEAPDTLCADSEEEISLSGFASDVEWIINGVDRKSTTSFEYEFVNNKLVDSIVMIQLNVSSVFSCPDTITKRIVVKPSLKADFDLTPEEQLFPTSTIAVTEKSIGEIILYNWSFGDSNISSMQTPQPHTYDSSGVYEVQLKVSNAHCVDSVIKIAKVTLPLPIARFQGSDTACVPKAVSFVNESLNGQMYKWSFGDGNFSEEENPTHTYTEDGIYSVQLVVSNSAGSDSITQEKNVYLLKQPVAFFNTTPNIGDEEIVAPAEFYFKNQSLNATKFVWDFDNNGDGAVAENVTYVYNSAGIYEPTLIVENEIGCADTFTVFPAIRVVESGKLHVPNVFNPNANLTTNQVFKPVVLGNVAEYSLVVYNRWGEVVFTSTEVDDGWDGIYLDKEAELGVYVYVIEVQFSAGNTEKVVGDVTLIR